MREWIRRHPVGSFVALTYLITWPLQIAALTRALPDDIEVSNEDNFGHFSDLLSGDVVPEVLSVFLLFNLGQGRCWPRSRLPRFSMAVRVFGTSAPACGTGGFRSVGT